MSARGSSPPPSSPPVKEALFSLHAIRHENTRLAAGWTRRGGEWGVVGTPVVKTHLHHLKSHVKGICANGVGAFCCQSPSLSQCLSAISLCDLRFLIQTSCSHKNTQMSGRIPKPLGLTMQSGCWVVQMHQGDALDQIDRVSSPVTR